MDGISGWKFILDIQYVFQRIVFYKDFLGYSPNQDRQDIAP